MPPVLRRTVIVFYDADCALCTLFVQLMKRLDALGLITYRPGIFARGQRIRSVMLDGLTQEGMNVMIQIAARSVSPLLWLTLPFLVVGQALFGQRPYDWVASRRHLIAKSSCRVMC